MPSCAGNDAPDRQLRGVAPLIALAAAVLVGGIVAWRLVVTIFDAAPQKVGDLGYVVVIIVNPIILGGSALLLLLLLLSGIFLRSRRHGAFIDTISLFFALSFLAVVGDALIVVLGLIAQHLSGDLLSGVGQGQTDLADAVVNLALLFVVLHIGAACLGIAARRKARAATTLPKAPQPTRATGSQDSALTAAKPLSDRDLGVIREFLQRRGSLEPLRRDQLATVIATEIHRHIGGEPPRAPEPYLEQLASTHDGL